MEAVHHPPIGTVAPNPMSHEVELITGVSATMVPGMQVRGCQRGHGHPINILVYWNLGLPCLCRNRLSGACSRSRSRTLSRRHR